MKDDERTTWRVELARAMRGAHDEGPILAYAPSEESFDEEFYPGYGAANGPGVLAWTEGWVYFPVEYDGAEWMDSAPRNPQADGQCHVGGQLSPLGEQARPSPPRSPGAGLGRATFDTQERNR